MSVELISPAEVDVLLIASRYVNFQGKPGKKYGGEYHGACPLPDCSSQNDAFMVWPYRPRFGSGESDAGHTWYCRRCGKSGDIINLVMRVEGMHFSEACELVDVDPEEWSMGRVTSNSSAMPKIEKDIAPSEVWQARAKAFAEECKANLWNESYQSVLAYLMGRGLSAATIQRAGLGYNPVEKRFEPRSLWGLSPEENDDNSNIWLPQGIVIPWRCKGVLWQLKIRRPKGERPKYWQVKGSSQGLFNVDRLLCENLPSCLLESELDSMLLDQEAGDLIIPIATGGTKQAQKAQWIDELNRSCFTLVATDVGDKNGAGDDAAIYWLNRLRQAVRYTPVHHDVTDSHMAGVSVRRWVELGIRYAQREFARKALPEPEIEIAPAAPVHVEMCLSYGEPPLVCRKCHNTDAARFTVHPLRLRWKCGICGELSRLIFPVMVPAQQSEVYAR